LYLLVFLKLRNIHDWILVGKYFNIFKMVTKFIIFPKCRDVEAARDVDGTAIAVCFPHPWTSVWSTGVGCRLQIVSIVTIAIFRMAWDPLIWLPFHHFTI